MGNQQAKLDRRLSWLGGIIDGEGCIHLAIQKHKWKTLDGEQVNWFVRPQITLVNTYKDGLEMIVNILKKYNIPHYIHWRTPNNPRYKKSWDLKLVGLSKCLKFCQLMEGYIIWKATELEAMKNFCESRLRRMHQLGEKRDHRIMPRFTDNELDCISKLRGRDIRTRLI